MSTFNISSPSNLLITNLINQQKVYKALLKGPGQIGFLAFTEFLFLKANFPLAHQVLPAQHIMQRAPIGASKSDDRQDFKPENQILPIVLPFLHIHSQMVAELDSDASGEGPPSTSTTTTRATTTTTTLCRRRNQFQCASGQCITRLL